MHTCAYLQYCTLGINHYFIVHIQIIEEMDERFSEQQVEEMCEIIRTHLPEAKEANTTDAQQLQYSCILKDYCYIVILLSPYVQEPRWCYSVILHKSGWTLLICLEIIINYTKIFNSHKQFILRKYSIRAFSNNIIQECSPTRHSYYKSLILAKSVSCMLYKV